MGWRSVTGPPTDRPILRHTDNLGYGIFLENRLARSLGRSSEIAMDIVRLRQEAERFRRLARGINDDALAAELERLAREMEQRAAYTLRLPEAPEGPPIA